MDKIAAITLIALAMNLSPAPAQAYDPGVVSDEFWQTATDRQEQSREDRTRQERDRRRARIRSRSDFHGGAALGLGAGLATSRDPSFLGPFGIGVTIGGHSGSFGFDVDLGLIQTGFYGEGHLDPTQMDVDAFSFMGVAKFFPYRAARQYDFFLFGGGGATNSLTSRLPEQDQTSIWAPSLRLGTGLYYRRGTNPHEALTWIHFRAHYTALPILHGIRPNATTGVGHVLMLELGFSINFSSSNFRLVGI